MGFKCQGVGDGDSVLEIISPHSVNSVWLGRGKVRLDLAIVHHALLSMKPSARELIAQEGTFFLIQLIVLIAFTMQHMCILDIQTQI